VDIGVWIVSAIADGLTSSSMVSPSND